MFSAGNWWLYVNGTDSAHAVGYYPTSLYQNGPTTSGATEIDFGGETVGTGAYSHMGSGAFASVGYSKAAHHRNITYFPMNAGVQDAALTRSQDPPSSYTIDLQKSAEWGQFFFFGGPGSAASVAAMAPPGAPILAPAAVARKFSSTLGSPPPQAQMRTRGTWALASLLFVGAMAGCGLWIIKDARALDAANLQTQWLLIEATLLALCIAAGYIANRRPDGLLIDEENRVSLARVQWAVWLIVLLGGFFVEAIWNVAVGFNDASQGLFLLMQSQLYALLGIVSGSAVVSSVIVNGKTNAPNAPPPPDKPMCNFFGFI